MDNNSMGVRVERSEFEVVFIVVVAVAASARYLKLWLFVKTRMLWWIEEVCGVVATLRSPVE